MRGPHPTPGLLAGALIVLSAVVAACGSSGPSARVAASAGASANASASSAGPTRIPLLTDVQDPVGTTRMLFGMLDPHNKSIGAPDLIVKVAFYDVASSTTTPVATVPATFLWTIPDQTGVYELTTTFGEPGDWIAEFISSKGGLTERTQVQFQVAASSTTPALGAKAPDTKTPTLADVGGDVKQLSTDTTPDPAFYQVSVHDALAQHKPFVLVFATPAFCTSRVCGPTLDAIKAIAKTEPTVTFINVEPYKMSFADGHLQPILDAQQYLQATDVTNAWGLPTEPWIFVVDRNGLVQGSWSTVVSAAELTKAIDAVK
ncbi:MAG TPA: hypothetical protein VF323_00570 [Candidatus Limnocylindrales bacterium]